MAGEFGPIHDISYAFLSILLEGLPFIVLGTLISGFIDAYLPPGLIDRWLPKNRVGAVALSGCLGAIFPVCECAVVPVIRRLIRKGLPVSCAITYMLSAPIINPIVFVSTWSAFTKGGGDPWFMAISRVLIAYGITFFVGLLLLKVPIRRILKERLWQQTKDANTRDHRHEHAHKHGHDEHEHDHGHAHEPEHDHDHDHAHDHDHHHHAPNRPKLVTAFFSAQRDFIDVAMYFVIGVAITAWFNTQVPQEQWVTPVASNDWLAAPALMVVAFLISLCSTSDAFVAAALDKFSYAAKLAFLVYGPMMDVKLLFMYSSVFRKRFVLALAVGLFILVAVVCVEWANLVLPWVNQMLGV